MGYFLNGFLHIKNTICFTTVFDFLPDRHKSMGSTFINFFDYLCLILFNLYLKYVNNDTQELFEALFWIYVVASIMYILFVPETPRFLFA